MRNLLLITLSFISFNITNAQTIDTKEYLSSETKDIITELDDIKNNEAESSVVSLIDIEVEKQSNRYFHKTFEVSDDEGINFRLRNDDFFTPVVTISKNKTVLKMVNESAPLMQSDGTNVFYANCDRIESAQMALSGVRVLVIPVKK
ncbi:hypothetical protein [Flammeovirga kamogawensis]|uniref:Uncharacterized protein n=1 Tax=Flammeovirga kamogawensis TaxID=373891 RepID=A0ABX8GW37_9BACT|nr:hypothetical protein [Flammeovirga kamogawensis]MBB6461256.1 hypothetical protein [Flammeovirga kamogawensis]QWG07815.1 hypothetical protein KM029_02420 [Flammeovirga kamogawensis]TRX69620.1 hypothetical protein EO216_16355 [Flammeovirga kamogawensis]